MSSTASCAPQVVPAEHFEQAVSFAAVADLERLLSDSPTLHSLTFWHDVTPLHVACLRGSDPVAVVQLLLQHGAAVDRCNAFGETPLMFACKRGVPELVAVLIQAGADALARDRAGRGLMHHTAMSGSVGIAHFLHTVLDMSCKDIDDRRQTPLHIVASIGHIELLQYFLRRRDGIERVDIHAADVFGNTALHVAATNGHYKICWQLLLAGGKTMVLAANKDGRTPLDVAQQLNTSKHRDAMRLLQHAHKLCTTRGEFAGPVVAWYWHLAMPACLSLVALGAARLLQDALGGHAGAALLALALLALAAIVYSHSHRMEHVCDWPNPIHAGSFAGGLVLTASYHLLLLFTGVGSHVPVAVLTAVLVPTLFYAYYRLLCGDPGFVNVGKHSYSSGSSDLARSQMKAQAIKEAASGRIPSVDRLCTVCEIYQDDDVKHCRLCDRCIFAMDHHCLYLMKCVARDNHRLFVAFIALVLSSQVVFLYAAWVYISQNYLLSTMKERDLPISDTVVTVLAVVLRTELFLSALVILNTVSVIWGVSVLGWQLKLVASGQTYYMSIKSQHGMPSEVSLRDKFVNVVHFVRGFKPHGKAACRQQCCAA